MLLLLHGESSSGQRLNCLSRKYHLNVQKGEAERRAQLFIFFSVSCPLSKLASPYSSQLDIFECRESEPLLKRVIDRAICPQGSRGRSRLCMNPLGLRNRGNDVTDREFPSAKLAAHSPVFP